MLVLPLSDVSRWPPENQPILGRKDDGFFDLPDWYRLVESCKAVGHQQTAHLLIQNDVAMACLHTPTARVLRSCTNMYSYEFGLLGKRDDSDSVYLFAKDLPSSFAQLDGIRFEGLDPQASYFPTLVHGIRDAGAIAKPFRSWPLWCEPTAGLTFDQYVAGRPSVLRNTWKKKRRLLEKEGNFTFQIDGGNDIETNIAIYEAIRRCSWKSAEPFPAFVPDMVGLAHQLGVLRFGILFVNAKPVAAQIWIVWKRRATIYKLVHDDDYAALSPGTLLTMEVIRSLFEAGELTELNFGRGDDKYKELWVRQRKETWGIEAAIPKTFRGMVWSASIRAAQLRDRIVGARPLTLS